MSMSRIPDSSTKADASECALRRSRESNNRGQSASQSEGSTSDRFLSQGPQVESGERNSSFREEGNSNSSRDRSRHREENPAYQSRRSQRKDISRRGGRRSGKSSSRRYSRRHESRDSRVERRHREDERYYESRNVSRRDSRRYPQNRRRSSRQSSSQRSRRRIQARHRRHSSDKQPHRRSSRRSRRYRSRRRSSTRSRGRRHNYRRTSNRHLDNRRTDYRLRDNRLSSRRPAQSPRRRSKTRSPYRSLSPEKQDRFGHFEFQIGDRIGRDFRIVSHLGDGTFGRVLKCQHLADQSLYAVKVVRAVRVDNECAQTEKAILRDIYRKGGEQHHIVVLDATFWEPVNPRKKPRNCDTDKHFCMAFEPLGKSLHEFIRANKYQGFHLSAIQEIARQILEGLQFLHEKLELTHTDLKLQNILFKSNAKERSFNPREWPANVRLKKQVYESSDSERSRSPRSSSQGRGRRSSGSSSRPGVTLDEVTRQTQLSSRDQRRRREERFRKVWMKPRSCQVKIIDFGGATYASERHATTISTRQYRAPEVLLRCQEWNEKTDLWSMACILLELYTGEMFYVSENDFEHLAMIEKQCGPLPEHMLHAMSIQRPQVIGPITEYSGSLHRLQLHECPDDVQLKYWKRMEVAKQLIYHEVNQYHKEFLNLVEFMMKVDPAERPSAHQCLEHDFFKLNIPTNSQ